MRKAALFGTHANMDLLSQHGKDFEAIQNNIALKYRKKGKPASMVKNKEQVRHFYYRTWHKITKYIDFDHGEHVGSAGHVAGNVAASRPAGLPLGQRLRRVGGLGSRCLVGPWLAVAS